MGLVQDLRLIECASETRELRIIIDTRSAMMGKIGVVLIAGAVLILFSVPAKKQNHVPDGVVHPIIGFIHILDNPCEYDFTVIGVSVDGEWDGYVPQIGSPDQYVYSFYSQDGFLGKTTGIRIYPGCNYSWQYEATLDVDLELFTHANADGVFGISADWNPLPRPVVDINPDQEWLLEGVREALILAKSEVDAYAYEYYTANFPNDPPEAHPWIDISTQKVAIDRAWSVDLNGDSEQEYVITALISDRWAGNQYGFIFPVLLDGDAGLPLNINDLECLVNANRDPQGPDVEYILDANGDGLMEIVIEYGCCAGSDCDFITLMPDGSIERVTFYTDRYD
jgi:hypothetical protein